MCSTVLTLQLSSSEQVWSKAMTADGSSVSSSNSSPVSSTLPDATNSEPTPQPVDTNEGEADAGAEISPPPGTLLGAVTRNSPDKEKLPKKELELEAALLPLFELSI
jgi:hypothetical protein